MNMSSQALITKSEGKTAHQRYARTDMKKKASKILSTAIIYFSLFIIGILAIPVCVFLVPIVIVWTLADKIVRRLERE